jgi:hypothetical protein
MYDMKPMAQSLASQGRYGDTMLVHMNPVEVAGLDAYTRKMGGGGLTVNPRTGQPEAFLPFLLGLGLQGLGMTALQAGLATGIGTAVATKDLGKGVLAGLGAFGGADVGAGLGAAGAASATSAVPGNRRSRHCGGCIPGYPRSWSSGIPISNGRRIRANSGCGPSKWQSFAIRRNTTTPFTAYVRASLNGPYGP